LTGQRALLDGQVKAEEGLHNLKQLQETVFEESHASVQALTREVEMHQKQYLAWQTEFHTMQKQMTRQSTAMLEAQVINEILSSVLIMIQSKPQMFFQCL
jgi:molecular chaperone GrpE (heat shock protein)